MRDDARFAAACTCEDEERTIDVSGCLALLGI
jgi:hypothetical protein